MSRIIESCRWCGHNRYLRLLDINQCIIGGEETAIIIEDVDTVLHNCPLPKLDDKMREAFAEGLSHGDYPYAKPDIDELYEDWRKQNEH